MSLFDVIRYPIDVNFRLEDLEHIPSNILNEWWDEVVEYRSKTESDLATALMKYWRGSVIDMDFYLRFNTNRGWKKYALKVLQRRLKENDR